MFEINFGRQSRRFALGKRPCTRLADRQNCTFDMYKSAMIRIEDRFCLLRQSLSGVSFFEALKNLIGMVRTTGAAILGSTVVRIIKEGHGSHLYCDDEVPGYVTRVRLGIMCNKGITG